MFHFGFKDGWFTLVFILNIWTCFCRWFRSVLLGTIKQLALVFASIVFDRIEALADGNEISFPLCKRWEFAVFSKGSQLLIGRSGRTPLFTVKDEEHEELIEEEE